MVVLIFARLLCSQGAAAQPVEYEVTGELRCHLEITSSAQKNTRYDFKMSVNGSNWFIHLVPRHSIAEPFITNGASIYRYVVPNYLEASSDGARFYTVVNFEGQKVKGGRSLNPMFDKCGDGPVPYSVDDEFTCLWYLYASFDYFKGDLQSRLRPLYAMAESAYHNADFRKPAQWVISEKPPGLPQTIIFPGALRSGEPSPTFTNSSLQVLKFEMVGAYNVPSHAQVDYYLNHHIKNGDRVFDKQLLRKRIEIEASTFAPKSSTIN